MFAASMAFGAAAQLTEGTEYYIRNAENGYYITGGFSWGTLAVQKESGRAFELVADGTNTYKFKSSCGFIKDGGDEVYVDGDESKAIGLTLVKDGDKYVITYGNRYLGENEVVDYQDFNNWHYQWAMSENTVITLKWHDDAANAIKWDFMTLADVHKAMESATEAEPIDVSFFLKGHNVEINDTDNPTAWTYVKNGVETDLTFPAKGWQDEFGGEQWCNKSTYIWCQNDGADGAEEGTDLLYQEIEGAPAGVYEAHYRVLNQSNTPLVINLNDTKAAPTDFDDSDLWYAEAYRQLHEYEETARFVVKEDGKLSVKLEKTIDPDDQNRFAFKSMRLKYMGKNADTAVITIAADENASVEYFNLQGVRVANPENGIFIVKKGNNVEKRVIR